MKIITEKEFSKFLFKTNMNPILNEVGKLKIMEHLFVSRKDWKLKTTIINIVNSNCRHPRGQLKGKRMSIRTLLDNSGWVITRVK